MESVCTFHIERMTAEHFPFAVQLSNTMNWNATIEDFQLAVALEPDGCFVLTDASNRVGIATTVRFGKVGWFGNLVVREEYRNKGAGSLLINHALEYLRNSYVETIGLYAYAYSTGIYERFGFKKDEAFSLLKGKSNSLLEMKPLERIQQQDFSSIIAFDSQCFGANRSKLLDPILQRKKNLCYASKDESGFKGYIASNVYERMATIGPLVCVSDGVPYAEALLGNVLNRLTGFEVFMCIPRRERALLSLLFSARFQEDFRVSRMFLGSRLSPKCIYIPESLERG